MVSVNYTLNIEILRKFISFKKSLKNRVEPVSFKCLLLITLQLLRPKKIATLLVIFFANFKVIATLKILSGRKLKKLQYIVFQIDVKTHQHDQIRMQKKQYSIINNVNCVTTFIIKL
jgi:hypothetical protein